MTKEEWESLIACPGWGALKRYLADWRQSLMEKIAEGNFSDPQPAIYRCQAQKDVIELDFATMLKFYAPPNETEPMPEV